MNPRQEGRRRRARASGPSGRGPDSVSGIKGGPCRGWGGQQWGTVWLMFLSHCGGRVLEAWEWRQGGQPGGCSIGDVQPSIWQVTSTQEISNFESSSVALLFEKMHQPEGPIIWPGHLLPVKTRSSGSLSQRYVPVALEAWGHSWSTLPGPCAALLAPGPGVSTWFPDCDPASADIHPTQLRDQERCCEFLFTLVGPAYACILPDSCHASVGMGVCRNRQRQRHEIL